MVEASGRRHQGEGIGEKASGRRHRGGGIVGEASRSDVTCASTFALARAASAAITGVRTKPVRSVTSLGTGFAAGARRSV